MEHNICNPFIPKASVIRYPNAIFELRLHLQGVASHVEVVQHDNYILVAGRTLPRISRDLCGRIGTAVGSDFPFGNFGRDIPLRLNLGTQIIILGYRQDCDDLVVRYTIRNRYSPFRYGPVSDNRQWIQYDYTQTYAPYPPPCGNNAGYPVTNAVYPTVGPSYPVSYPTNFSFNGASLAPCGHASGCTCYQANAHLGFGAGIGGTGHHGGFQAGFNVDVGGGVSRGPAPTVVSNPVVMPPVAPGQPIVQALDGNGIA